MSKHVACVLAAGMLSTVAWASCAVWLFAGASVLLYGVAAHRTSRMAPSEAGRMARSGLLAAVPAILFAPWFRWTMIYGPPTANIGAGLIGMATGALQLVLGSIGHGRQ